MQSLEVKTSTPFDVCVLTAANEQQAKGYRIQLEWRRRRGQLPDTEFMVIADPDGRRIGSGGSTFFVLEHLRRSHGDDVFKKRILMLHSGGDSRRLPAYSAVGKLFTPLPAPNYMSLFDIMIENYAQLPVQPKGQLVVASGDVLLNFDPAFMDFSTTGITGVAYPENPDAGRFFGVYVVHEPDARATRVADVLQKPGRAELEAAGAVDFGERIWIDTGILNLAPDALEAFLSCTLLQQAFARGELNYNLYHDILYAVHGKLPIVDAELLAPIPLFVNCLPYCGFYHVGRSEELLHNFYTLTHASAKYHFSNSARSNAALFPEMKSAWVYNTIIETPRVSIERPCLIEGCHLDDQMTLEGENMLTGLPRNAGPITLRAGICLTLLPLSDRWAAVIYGLHDSFKGTETTFLNKPVADGFAALGISAADVWPAGEPHDLWNAKLFPACRSAMDATAVALAMQDGRVSAAWRAADRLSMSEIMLLADQEKMLEHRAEIERRTRLLTLGNVLSSADFSLSELTDLLRSDDDRRTVEQHLKKLHGSPDLKARAEFWLGCLAKESGKDVEAEIYFQQAFSAIREAVGLGLEQQKQQTLLRRPIRSDEVVWTLLPARLDFAGGWTDTPPICLERGGCVLNASVTLNGQYPIQVVGKIRPQEFIVGINSIDLGKRAALTSIEELRDFGDPADWLSLPKAAFHAAGLFPADFRGNLHDLLEEFGGGIDLTLFSALPAGSGLGTSSILGAGLITTLVRLAGQTMSRDEVYARTSNLEQLMTTGGGWQDQIGGVAGGIKLITTRAGYDQTPTLAWTNLKQPGMEFGDRFLLYYTGHRRLAKNLLRQVVGRYLKREREALAALDELAALARDMKNDLDHRRVDDFGRKIQLAWVLNKTLDQGQTTDAIEAVLARISDWILGAKLLGAGGGGFLFIVAKDGEAAGRIRNELTVSPPNERARFFDFDIDADGLKLSVL